MGVHHARPADVPPHLHGDDHEAAEALRGALEAGTYRTSGLAPVRLDPRRSRTGATGAVARRLAPGAAMTVEPKVTAHLRELLEARDAEGLDAFTARCVWAGIDADEIVAELRALRARLPLSTRSWWNEPCDRPGCAS